MSEPDLIVRYVPANHWLVWLRDGWEITWLGGKHGEFSVLASKREGPDDDQP